MTNADQGASDQQNVSQQSGFEQVEEDAHVTITPVHDTHKAYELVQSSSVSFDFTSKLLNLENPSPADNEIASLMETSDRHAMAIPKNTSGFTTTIPSPPSFFNLLQQEATPTPTPTTSETTTSLLTLPDFASVFKFNERVFHLEKYVSEIKQVDQYAQALSSIPAIFDRYMDNKLGEAINKAILAHNLDCRQEAQDEKNAYIELVDTSMRALIKEEVNTQLPQILPQAISYFATPVIEKNVTETLEAVVLTRSSSQPRSTYEAVASLSEFELTKILIDKMEKNKSYDKDDYKKKLYDALVESYNTDKDLFDSYGEVFSLKRSRDEDKDRDPSARSNREKKRRKSSKYAKSSRDSSLPMQRSQVILLKTQACNKIRSSSRVTMMNNPLTRRLPKSTGLRNLSDLQLLILIGGGDLSRKYSTSVTKTKAATYELKWIKDLVSKLWSPIQLKNDQHAYFGTSHWGPKRQSFYKYASNMTSSKDIYSRRRIIAVTRLIIMKKYDYVHLEEIEVRRNGQKLYTFKEGDFKRLRLQDIEDMLLLLVQQKLTNLTIDERYDLNVALPMYTRHQFKRKRLIRADELHKFNDGILNDVQTALHDIAAGIRMEYLPMRK
ncbi:hypothetical protein Tco_0277109 [Tanacetum coccineum]